MSSPIAIFFPLVFLAALTARVQGHGCMVKPCPRGTLNTNSIFNSMPRRKDLYIPVEECKKMKPPVPADNCPHCLNGGGKGAVMLEAKNNWTPYEPLDKSVPFRHDSGLCGDPKNGAHDHEAGGKYGWPKSPIVATYKQGSVVEFVVDITTNHNGFFEYFICDASKCGGDINEKCFKDGHCHQLMREKTPECEAATSKECAPVDPAYPGRWYIGCRKGGHVGEHFVGGKYMRYLLPKGFNTAHAVIQFYWVTANSCNPPGFNQYFKNYPMEAWGKCGGDGGAIGGRNPTFEECGGGNFPEEFWNCADVAVTGSGAAGTVAMAPEPPATTAPIDAAPETVVTSKPAPSASPKPAATTSPRPAAVETAAPTQRARDAAQETAERARMHAKAEEMNELAEKKGNTMETSEQKECTRNWHPCGGKYWSGPTTCCSSDYYCRRINDYFSHCAKRIN